MRPRVRGIQSARYVSPPTHAHAPAAEPQYRWTFKTWVKKEWCDWDQRSKTADQNERTMTVIAPTEADAKRKIEAALPPVPAEERDSLHPSRQPTTYIRKWLLEGEVTEVTP